jgi:hypothetical protein
MIPGGAAYLVYGWRVDEGAMRRILADFPPEAAEMGLRVVIRPDGKMAYIGDVLGALDGAEDRERHCRAPEPGDVGRLRRGMTILRLDGIAAGEPGLWLVRG